VAKLGGLAHPSPSAWRRPQGNQPGGASFGMARPRDMTLLGARQFRGRRLPFSLTQSPFYKLLEAGAQPAVGGSQKLGIFQQEWPPSR
jgi:hypothetical protein